MEEVMGDLEKSGLRNLDAVRAKLFTFEDILALSKKALVRLFDDLSSEVVAPRRSAMPIRKSSRRCSVRSAPVPGA